MHVKDPAVHVRSLVDYANRKTLHAGGGKKLGSAVLCLLAFPNGKQPDFPVHCNLHWDRKSYFILTYFILFAGLRTLKLYCDGRVRIVRF